MNNGAGLDFSTGKEDGLMSKKGMVKNDQNLGPDKARGKCWNRDPGDIYEDMFMHLKNLQVFIKATVLLTN